MTDKFGPNGVLHSSQDMTWATPQWLYDVLDEEFRFDLDVCATPATAKAPRYYTPADDALSQPWNGRCWMNPPYGREIGKWIAYAYGQVMAGNARPVVCLIPARTDTAWWHDYVQHGLVYLLRGRLKFGDATNSAPFPSAVVVFRRKMTPAVYHWHAHAGEPLP